MRQYSFFVHFNRVNMQRGNERVWTIHFRGKCHQVKGVCCLVPCESRYLPSGRQPRATLRGRARYLVISRGGWGTLYNE